MIKEFKCENCGSTKNLRRHHTKYNELQNQDEIIIVCESCHTKIHMRLRQENKCHVPAELLAKYSDKACHKEENKNRKRFYSTIGEHVLLYETIDYHPLTG